MSQGRNSGGGNRRNRNYHHHGNRSKPGAQERSKNDLSRVDSNSPIVKQFKCYAAELDDKHDRYERIVKLCRDITIESKRIIFLLHTLDKDSKRDAILSEAKTRLDNLGRTLFRNIAVELDGQDPYQYVRAYRMGLQEFIEAMTFYRYTRDTIIDDWHKLEETLTYSLPMIKSANNDEEEANETRTIATLVAPNDYILGIADLTGELMRKCISNLASGDIESCYGTCNFVRDMYRAFLGCVGMSAKEINKKLYVLQQSLMKMENVCYAIRVRGSEIPKHMLADVANVANDDYPADDDEGYQIY